MDQDEFDVVKAKLAKELESYDILHIQHEFTLYSGNQFAQIVNIAKSMGKRVVVTVHTSPTLIFNFKPRSSSAIINYLRKKRFHLKVNKNHIYPMRKVDLLITHNKGATNSVKNYGVGVHKILQTTIPVLKLAHPRHMSTEITDRLRLKPEDIVYATVGFMHENKNIIDAVKALKYLPNYYKLAIIGGMHPTNNEANIYNSITDFIDKEG